MYRYSRTDHYSQFHLTSILSMRFLILMKILNMFISLSSYHSQLSMKHFKPMFRIIKMILKMTVSLTSLIHRLVSRDTGQDWFHDIQVKTGFTRYRSRLVSRDTGQDWFLCTTPLNTKISNLMNILKH